MFIQHWVLYCVVLTQGICLLSLYNTQQLDKVKNVLKCALVIKGCNLGVAQRGSSKRKCMFSKTWLM